MAKRINYTDKTAIQNDETIKEENKVTDGNMNEIKKVVNENADELEEKQNKEIGKGLSTNDFTNEYRQKLDELENYDDTLVKQDIEKIKNKNEFQDKDIENLQQKNIQLQEELEQTKTNLENYAIHGKESGEYIHLTDSSETDCRVDVRGNAKQVVTEQSANTLDLTKLSITEKPNVEIDDISANEVTFHTTNNTASSYYLRFKTILKKGTYYARKLYNLIDGTAVTGNNGSGVIFISKSDWSKEFIRLYNNVEKGSFSLQEDTEVYITLMLGKVENGKIRFYNLMLANSDVEYTPFVPASPSLGYPSKIETVKDSVKVTSCNKNLFDVGENNYSTMGLNITLDKSRIKINGTPTSNNYILKKDNINAICLGKFKKGTYHITRQQFSGFTKKGNGFSVQIRKDAYDGTTLVSYGMETILQQKKFVLNENVDLYLAMWANKDDIYNDVEFLFSIYSDNDVNYVQHEEQSYIMPIQAEMLEGDYFDKVNKKEVHTWEKRIWNGTENWTLDAQNTNDEYISFRTQIEDMVSLNSQNTQLITDKIINEYGGITLNKEHLWVYGINVVVCIKKERLESLDVLGFKKYLTQNNVIVYYKLAEPKKLDLTQEQIQALEKLDKLKTYKNITNITTDSIAILDVDYKKDLETLLNQITKESEA